MRPIKISIEGLNSFREKVTVDFEELGKEGIFGIFGKTGSGKSTILDAITFALYGVIARYGSKYGACINENENEALVELEFSIMDKEAHRYKVRRSIKRKPNGDYGSLAASLIDASAGDLPIADRAKEVTRKVEDIIGLNYDEFVKTVVLPQGSFKDFLVMEGAERRKILERIFGLEKYGKKINAVVKAEKAKVNSNIDLILGEIKGIGDVTKDSLKEEESILKEEKNKFREHQEMAQKYMLEAKGAERILELREKLEEAESLHSEFMEKEVEIKQLKEMQEKSEKAEKVAPLIKQREEKILELENLRKNLQNAESALEEAKKIGEEREESYKEAKKYYDENYARGIRRCAVLEGLEKDWDKYIVVKKEEEDKGRDFSVLKDEKLEAEKSLAESEETKEKLLAGLAELEKEIKETEEFVKEEGRLITALNLYKNIEKNLVDKKEKTKEIFKIDQEVQDINESLEVKRKLLEETKNTEKEFAVSIIKSELRKGDICPVCGKTFEEENQMHFDDGVSKKEAEGIKERREGLELEIAGLGREVERKLAAKEFAQKDIEKKDVDKETWEKELLEIYPKEKWKDLEIKLQIVQEKKDKRENLEIKLKTLKTQIDENFNELKIAEKNKMEAEKKYEFLDSELARLGKEVKEFEEKIKENLENIEDPKIQKIKVEKALQVIEERLSKAAESLEEAKVKGEEAKRNVSAESAKVETLEKDVKKEREKVRDEVLKHYDIDVYNLLNGTIEREVYKKIQSEYLEESAFLKNKETIEIYEKKLAGVNLKIEELRAQGKGETRTTSELQRLMEESRETQEKLEEQKKQIAVLESRLKAHMEAFERKREKEETLRKLEKRGELLETLSKLFEASKFAEYMAIENLKYISLEAGNTLKTITGGKYSLIADEEGSFKIQDFKNGGVIRSVKTMSGGETFVVSLSLALALSAQLQLKGNAPIELFFLDEGFGTLDDELLDVVMDSLERLASDRFKIGIVSHVEQLKQRMPVRLVVSPQEIGKGGSKVKIEYN